MFEKSCEKKMYLFIKIYTNQKDFLDSNEKFEVIREVHKIFLLNTCRLKLQSLNDLFQFLSIRSYK